MDFEPIDKNFMRSIDVAYSGNSSFLAKLEGFIEEHSLSQTVLPGIALGAQTASPTMSERAVQTDYSAQPETIQIPTPQEAIEQEAAGETGIIGDDVETVPPLDDQHELTVAVDMKRISERI